MQLSSNPAKRNPVRLPKFLDLPIITIVVPIVALGLLLSGLGDSASAPFLTLVALAVVGTVLVAVVHAEIIAQRMGEPLGTLVLALAVTVIEVSLIVSMMLFGGDDARSLARDTVFATAMIICNGVVGALSIAMGITLDLGLPAKEIVLLALTLLVSAITVVGGQATIMQGTVHLVLFAAFLFLVIVP